MICNKIGQGSWLNKHNLNLFTLILERLFQCAEQTEIPVMSNMRRCSSNPDNLNELLVLLDFYGFQKRVNPRFGQTSHYKRTYNYWICNWKWLKLWITHILILKLILKCLRMFESSSKTSLQRIGDGILRSLQHLKRKLCCSFFIN